MKSYLPVCVMFMLLLNSQVHMAESGIVQFVDSDKLIVEAVQLGDSGYYEGATDLLNQVLKTDPNYAWACYEMALNYYNSGNKEEALIKCKEADFLHYDHPYLYSLIGSILDELGKHNDGIGLLSEAHNRWPYNQNIIYNLGICYLNAGKPDSAERWLQKGIVIYPYHTRSHLALAKANYAMGRLAQSYLALSMAILLNPATKNIREFENTIVDKLGIIPRSYQYPYPDGVDHKNWDNLKYLLQSEMAFNKSFDYSYNLDYTFTRQSYLLFRNLHCNESDTSVYNLIYSRLFSEIMQKNLFETYINYCMNNIGNSTASAWNEKNPGKIDGFISWAQGILDKGRPYAYLPENEYKEVKIHHFDDQGNLNSIGEKSGTDEVKNGTYLVISGEGGISEKGTYVNDLAEGEYLIFWPNGQVKQKLNFLHNQLNGTINTFYPNGTNQWIYPFVLDNKEGTTEEYSGCGLLTQTNSFIGNSLNGPGVYNNYKEGYAREVNYSADTLNGKTIEKWLDGTPKCEYNLIMGSYDGTYKSWYPNGKPESAYFYTDNLKTGRWVNYHYNGTISSEGENNLKGNIVGKSLTFDRNGKLLSAEKEYVEGMLTGYYTLYFTNGSEQVKRSYVQDTLKKIESYDDKGQLLYSAVTSGDSLYFKSFYGDGILLLEGLLISGKNEGNWKKFNPLGMLIEDYNYHNGWQSGPQKKYFANGMINEEFSCDSNNIIGPYKAYYISGHIQTTANYVKKGVAGELITYFENDSVNSRYFYKNGTLCGRSFIYNPDGKIASEEFYNDEGTAIRTIVYNHLGMIEGDWNYEYGSHEFTSTYPNGQTKSLIHICDNVKHGMQEEYYPNGQLASQINYLHGKPHGMLHRYDYNGSLETAYNYILGKLDGDGKLYKDGVLDYQVYYENGINRGKLLGYYFNGKLEREINVENEERHGYSDYYAPDEV
jgi:antitoxin component YwqK of YwqJK toxin-antitoxin module/Tfp pilus assembly protein PilF